MKAYPLREVKKIKYEDVPTPNVPSGWCLVKVKAAGICSSDIPRIYSKGTYHFPTICGHEFSGIVSQVSNSEDATLIGKKVGVFPLIPCKNCSQCKQGKYEMCSNYDYIGSRRDGAFAEYVAVPTWNLIELDSEISFEEAAMMEPLAVALHAVKRMKIKETDKIAIIGTGMIAFAAAQWCAIRSDNPVTIIGRSDSKKFIADKLNGIIYVKSQDCNETFDCILEAVGSNESIDQAINMANAGGQIVLMGNPEGDICLSQNTYWKILRRQLMVTGTWNSSYEKNCKSDWSEVRDALSSHSITVKPLISHCFSQEELLKALELMHNRKEPYCKVMTIWNKEIIE